MKKIFKVFGVVLVTIVIIALALLSYLLIKNPLGIGEMIKAALTSDTAATAVTTDQGSNYDHPLLSSEQEAKLTAAGVDIGKIPTTITVGQQKCATDKLGESRIKEIMSGANPTPLEILKLTPCL